MSRVWRLDGAEALPAMIPGAAPRGNPRFSGSKVLLLCGLARGISSRGACIWGLQGPLRALQADGVPFLARMGRPLTAGVSLMSVAAVGDRHEKASQGMSAAL